MEKELSGRRLWQIASAIRQRVLVLQNLRYVDLQGEFQNVISDLEDLSRVKRNLELCMNRGWWAAATSVADQAARLTRNVPFSCQQMERIVNARVPFIPTIREVLAELQEAEEEFDELRYYPENNCLAVVTEAVELQDVYLGEFEIRLHIDAIGKPHDRSAYRVVALDAHPAARNDQVTHPHVNEERLCAGDAGAALDTALAEGRICDFFILVRSVLTNYNRDSAYVTLEDWDGSPCHDCGSVMGEDNTYYCTSCDNDFCGECSSCCDHCDDSTCLGCLETCPVCDDRVCNGCMTTCPECGKRLCRRCHKEARCPCLEEEPENEEESHDNDSDRTESAAEGGEADGAGGHRDPDEAAAPVTAQAAEEGTGEDRASVHADGLGETALLP